MMEKGLYLVDWMDDNKGLFRMPLNVHVLEGAFLVVSWPADAVLDGWGVPIGGAEPYDPHYWGAFHRLTGDVLEDVGTSPVWVNSALVRSLRRVGEFSA